MDRSVQYADEENGIADLPKQGKIKQILHYVRKKTIGSKTLFIRINTIFLTAIKSIGQIMLYNYRNILLN